MKYAGNFEKKIIIKKAQIFTKILFLNCTINKKTLQIKIDDWFENKNYFNIKKNVVAC